MKKPSFSKVNYTLRPNKNVERKLIVEALAGLKEQFDIPAYAYIGLGSMWFVDFILIHKMLLIESMYSIERQKYSKRANFNRPYDCIIVKPGDTTIVLPELDLETQRCILWLDYDTGLDGPVMEDSTIVCEKAISGSVFILTINANHKRLDDFSDREEELSEKRIKALKYYAGDFSPPGLKYKDITNRYPEVLAEILFTKFKVALKMAGRVEKFLPLFNIVYADTSTMLTVGGMIVNQEDKEKLDRCNLFGKFKCVRGEEKFLINVPHLTLKEKTELDRMLPRKEPPTVAETDEMGFPLEEEELISYHHFYRYYPVFGEFSY